MGGEGEKEGGCTAPHPEEDGARSLDFAPVPMLHIVAAAWWTLNLLQCRADAAPHTQKPEALSGVGPERCRPAAGGRSGAGVQQWPSAVGVFSGGLSGAGPQPGPSAGQGLRSGPEQWLSRRSTVYARRSRTQRGARSVVRGVKAGTTREPRVLVWITCNRADVGHVCAPCTVPARA